MKTNKITTFGVDTIGECWKKSLQLVMDNGDEVYDDGNKLLEICNLAVTIKRPNVNDFIVDKYADKDRISLMIEKYHSCSIIQNYKISYGKLLYDYDNVNQIEWLIKRLHERPFTKSATIALHPPGMDNLSCLSLIDIKIRKNLLNMNCIYRSQNIFGSQPGNLIAMRTIFNELTETLSITPGVINLYALSGHIYEYDFQKVKSLFDTWDKDLLK